MKNLIVFIATFLISIPAFCEEFTWEEVETPQGGELKIIVLDSNGTYWGVTRKYDLYYREFGADAWVEKETNTETLPLINGFVTAHGGICFYSDYKLLISTDRGNHWEIKEFPGAVSCVRSNINNILYVELFTILYRSTDLGSNWEHVYGHEGYFMVDQASSISVTPFGDYAQFHPAMGDCQFMYSTDDGVNWLNITDSLTGITDIMGIGDVVYNSEGYMIIGTTSQDSTGRFVLTLFASENGNDWKAIAESKFDTTITDGASISSAYFLHSGKLIKWNKSEDFPGVTVFDDSYTIEEYFYYAPSEEYYALAQETDISIPDYNGIYGVRISFLKAGSGDYLFTSGDGGIYKLDPEDDSWELWEIDNEDNDYIYLGPTKDDNYLIYKKDSKSFILLNGDGPNIVCDSVSEHVVTPYFCNDVLIFSSYGRHFISYDYGENVYEMSTDGLWHNDGYGYISLSDFLIGPGDVHFRISKFHREIDENTSAAANSFLSRTTDRGQSWEELINTNIEFDKDTSTNSIIQIYGAVSPQGLLYYATHFRFDYAPLKVSNDNGDTFTDCMQGINGDEYFYGNMFFSPKYNHTLLLTNKNLYLSKDSYTWELITPDIEYEVKNACFTSDGIIYVLDSYGNVFKSTNPVSVEENIYAKSPQIYPNPTDNALYINLGTEYSGTAKLKLISITGITVIEKGYTHSQQPLWLDVSGLQTGVYILSVSNDGELFNRKVIIE